MSVSDVTGLCELCQCNFVYMLGVALASVSVTSVSDSCVNAGLTWSNAICQWRNESVFGKKKMFWPIWRNPIDKCDLAMAVFSIAKLDNAF